jgi:hypothetical protein
MLYFPQPEVKQPGIKELLEQIALHQNGIDENENVEDMILELNRIAQSNNGVVP